MIASDMCQMQLFFSGIDNLGFCYDINSFLSFVFTILSFIFV